MVLQSNLGTPALLRLMWVGWGGDCTHRHTGLGPLQGWGLRWDFQGKSSLDPPFLWPSKFQLWDVGDYPAAVFAEGGLH